MKNLMEGQLSLFDLADIAAPTPATPVAPKAPKPAPKVTDENPLAALVEETAKAPVKKAGPKKAKPSFQEQFVKTWDNRPIEDWGSGVSSQFKVFAKEFKKYLKSVSEDLVLNWYNVGHYGISASVNFYGVDFYLSYSVPRGGMMPLDFIVCSPMKGVLVRTQKEPKDYTGGNNNFCSVRGLPIFLTGFAESESTRRKALAKETVEAEAA